MLLLVGFIWFSLSKARLTEDISSIIPQDKRIDNINFFLKNSKVSDQLIFHFQLADSTTESPDSLIAFARPIMEALANDTTYVKEVTFEINEEHYAGLYNYFYENLPYYLDSTDYALIKANLTDTSLNETLKKGFMSLVSPAGVATKQYIFKDPLNMVPRVIKRLEKFRMDDNFTVYNSHIFTTDYKHLLAFVTPVYPANRTADNQKFIENIDKILSTVPANSEYITEYYGGTAVAVANAQRIKTDVIVTVTLAIIILLLFFILVFRRLRVVLILLFPVIFGTILALAVLVLLEGSISAISLGIGAVLLGINVDYGVHYFAHYRNNPSVKTTLHEVSVPILLGSATTAIAFMCLYVVRSEALNQLGLLAAISVVLTTVFVLIFMPLFLKQSDASNQDFSYKVTLFDKIAAISFEKNVWWVSIMSVIAVLVVLVPANVGFNSDISTLNYLSPKLKKADANLKAISSETLGSVYLITKGSTVDEALQRMEMQEPKLKVMEQEQLIGQRSSVTDLMISKQQQTLKLKQWNAFWDSMNREKVQQSLITTGKNWHFKETAFNDFYALINKPFTGISNNDEKQLQQMFLKNYIMESDTAASVVTILKVDQQHKKHFYDTFGHDDNIVVFDQQYFVNQFFSVLNEDFGWLVNLSAGFVFLVLLLSFGRIELTLVTFVPLLISWFLTLWLMKLVGVEFNIFNVIISTFILGLGDDFCIFMLKGLQDKYKYGKGDLKTFRLSALLSSFTVITGIGVLIFAGHPALKSIALVSILGIIAVIIVSFTLVPVFFNFLVLHRGRPRVQPVTAMNLVVSISAFIIFLVGAITLTLLIPILLILPLKRKRIKLMFHYLIAGTFKFVVSMIFPIKKKVIGREKLNFKKPSLIIANHQSHLDLAIILKLHPKIIVLTNKWVWNNPFYGFVVHFADYYPVFKGFDHELDRLKKKVDEGYSILIFPEGTRTVDGNINRFHQGAFLLADQLGLEIQPMLIHGANHCMYKNEFFLRSGQITLKILDRIKTERVNADGSYRHQAKATRRYFQEQLQQLSRELETPEYFRKQLFSQYIYKGPVLEWYMKVKVSLENNYSFFDNLIPKDATVTDIGCGYGFMSSILAMTSPNRKIMGVDYDEMKIDVAQQANIQRPNISFKTLDVTVDDIPVSEVYVLNDVLHYFPLEQQQALIEKCVKNVGENGMIIIRDADSDLVERTKMTKYTEFFSTRLLKFNKINYKSLTYTSGRDIERIALANNFTIERIDNAKFTSNILFILRPQPQMITEWQSTM
jgi:1-acyl-sn-glycerol-3-phosphate acyltransferase